jgi:hypothetical protein
MKNAWQAKAFGAIISAVVLAGCSSTQPDTIATRSASLSFETKASVALWYCYESPFTYCFPDEEGAIPVQKFADRPVPWRYSIEVTIIRAGTVYPVLATSVSGVLGSSVVPLDSVDDFVSLTDYDPDQPPAPDKVVPGIGTFTDGKKVSSASPIYLATVFVDPGIPNILDIVSATPGTPATFDFELNTGDTVIVRARKQQVTQAPQVTPPYENIKLSATLSVAGSNVTGQGPQTSSIDDKSGFTFSFTVR